MSMIHSLSGLLQRGLGSSALGTQENHMRARRGADNAAAALTRSLLQNAASQDTANGTGALPTPATGNPLESNLGQLVDLRATLVKATEDTSLTIKTAEGDTVTLTAHSETESLKARMIYAPGSSPQAAPANGSHDEKGERVEGDGDGDDHGMNVAKLREFQLDEKVTLSVQGELSDAELADIKKLVDGLGDALHDLGHGEDNAGNASLAKLDTTGFGSLAGFELHAERSVEVTKIHVRRLPPAPAPATFNPADVPGKGTVNTLPQPAAEPPVAAKPKDKPTGVPSQTPAAAPVWKFDFKQFLKTSSLDLLFARPVTTTVPGLPAADPTAPLPESPVAKL